MNRDLTYCLEPDCPFKDCERHCSRAPKEVPISIAKLSRVCRRYIDQVIDEIEKEERKA